MQYRADTKRALRQIANALGVANVLEGVVGRDGNHVRVSTDQNLELIRSRVISRARMQPRSVVLPGELHGLQRAAG